MTPEFAPFSRRGSALITTLLVIVVLTIIVTAFLQSMTVERQTARSYLNRYRADLAAQAAASESEYLLRKLFENYPDSCTAWGTFPNTRGTIFYYRTQKGTNTGALPKDAGIAPGVDLKAWPLISGATPQLISNLTEATVFAGGLSATNSVDLNRQGWIGGPSKSDAKQVIRAVWVDLLEDPSKPRDDSFDRATGRPKNGPVGRYAFWIEDNSFRINVNVAGSKPRGDSTAGRNPADSSIGDSPSDVSIKGTTEAVENAPDIADGLLTLRNGLPGHKLLSPSEVSYASGASTDTYDVLKFFLTTHSSELNLSRGGVKRLNLNDVVLDTFSSTDIRAQLDRIIAAIKNDNAMPDFGQRFYLLSTPTISTLNGTSTVTATDAQIYLQKIAANIRDYIDTDSQPTIVNNDDEFTVRPQAKPDATSPIGWGIAGSATGPSDVAAIGKEAVPALQEYAFRVKLKTFTVGTGSAHYKFEQDYYFEFFNPTTQDINISDLGPNPFLLISNQFGYDTGTGAPSILPGRPFSVPLSSFVDGNGTPLEKFPAGRTTVLTTDDNPAASLSSKGVDVSTYFRASSVPPVNRIYEGETTRKSGSKYRVFAQLGNTYTRGGSSTTDYDVHMLLGNDNGLIESFTALPTPAALSIHNDDGTQTNDQRYFFEGGSLKGNGSGGGPPQTGDPRSLNEQLSIQRWVANSAPDATRFFDSSLSNGPPASSTLGTFQNGFVTINQWPDYLGQTNTSDPTGAANAPGVIANAKLSSIGQLGDIYDPVRLTLTPSSRNIKFARGGGRTLRIGQPETFSSTTTNPNNAGLWDGNETSISRNRAAWRLADVFSTVGDDEIKGVVNINGVGRDNGAVLRGLFYKLKFGTGTTADATIQGKDLIIDELVKAAQTRFPSSSQDSTSPGDPSKDLPLWERGEMSELKDDSGKAIFDESTKIAGVNMASVLDRGREEVVRRSIELITTKGNIYTAYCIGQATDLNSGNLTVKSTRQMKVTFRIEPIYNTILPADNQFDGATEEGIEDRFRKPDHYTIRILSVDEI